MKVIAVAVSVPVTSTLCDAGEAHTPAKPTKDMHASVVTVKELAKATTILLGIILAEGVKVMVRVET